MKRQKKDWKKEVARDILALGSIPFYLIVFIRILIMNERTYIYQLLIAGLLLVLFSVFIGKIKLKADFYTARSFVLLIFTALFYNEIEYTIFASLLWIGLLISSNYLNRGKKKIIINGLLLGILSVAIAYFLSSFVF
jgi:energy-coupling factor transporter transmembrane protein EcfT